MSVGSVTGERRCCARGGEVMLHVVESVMHMVAETGSMTLVTGGSSSTHLLRIYPVALHARAAEHVTSVRGRENIVV